MISTNPKNGEEEIDLENTLIEVPKELINDFVEITDVNTKKVIES